MKKTNTFCSFLGVSLLLYLSHSISNASANVGASGGKVQDQSQSQNRTKEQEKAKDKIKGKKDKEGRDEDKKTVLNSGLDVQTPSPPFSEGIFPCTNCHVKGDYDSKRRELKDEHTNIKFEHDAQNRWCLDCHSAGDRDKLHLASGELIDFTQSYRLCGQCHGPNYRDWKAGVHGKRSGYWNGPKKYYLCVHCHNPHSPKIKQIKPFPAPVKPASKALIRTPVESSSEGDNHVKGK